jgi:hypothetical protein
VAVKVKVGQTKNIRLVAAGEKKPFITPNSVALGFDTTGDYVRQIEAGQGIIVTPDSSLEGANVVISHANTSTQLSSNNGILEFTRNVDLDQFGHITGLENTSLNPQNFFANTSVISTKDITFGNTAITLGETTSEIRGVNLEDIVRITGQGGIIDMNFNRFTTMGDPVNPTDGVNKRYLETEIEGVEFRTKIISDPVEPTDAANKRYVDGKIQGFVVRNSALAATTADLGAVFDSGNSTFASTLTLSPRQFLYVDDVTTWDLGSNLVVKDQNNPEENGSYDLIQVGDANTAWVFQRTEWSNESSEIPGSYEFVTDGTQNAGTGWVIIVDDASTFQVNDDPINWSQFSGEGTYVAGTGLTLTGRQFSVNESQILSTINPVNDVLTVSGGGAITIPAGVTGDRPTPATGMIRFNTTDGRFEAYDGVAWTGLGGVVDVDQNTYISAEDSPGADNNQLKFYAGGTLAATFDANTASFTGNVDIAGNVNIGGNITIGDANTDSITVAADFDSHLIANTHNTFDLGKQGVDWRTLYVQNIKGSGDSVTFTNTGAIIVPSANTSLRPSSPQEGMFRFNTEENRFEGYDGTQWNGLAGSVIDLDRNTYIIAETSAGANNNELDFWTDGVHRMQIDSIGDLKFGSSLDDIIFDYSTGNLIVNSEISANGDLTINPTGNIDVANNTITGLADPVNPTDAVNLRYLDNSFESGLTIIDGANTYSEAINLIASPTIEIGEGLELEALDSANNSFKIGLDKPGNITPGIYGTDRFMPRFRLTEDGRIDFATEIPVELQANAIPDFTETSRDIIALMFTDAQANGANEGISFYHNDPGNEIYAIVDNFNIILDGNLSGTAEVNRLSNTTIDATITAPYLRTLDVTGANSGIIVTHTPGANTTAILDLDYAYLDTQYVPATGGTYSGDIYAPRYYDSDNNSFYMDPAGTSRINDMEVGFGGSFGRLKIRDGVGSWSYLYASTGKIGFLDNTFNYASYSERSTGNWFVPNGDVLAERFIDHDAQTYFLHPGGTDSYLKQIQIEDKLTVSGIAMGGDLGARTIKTTTGILNVDASGGISLQGNGNDLNVNNSKITNLLDPTANQDAATKAYVDSVAQGLRIIPAALAATTEDIGVFGGGIIVISANTTLDIDGVTSWDLGDRLLVKDQIVPAENGSYVLTQVGDANTSWQFTRGEYFNESSEIPGSFQFVVDGTTNGSTGWVATVADAETFVIGTDAITWYQFSGAGTYTAGDALTLTGTEFSISDGDIQNSKLANPNFIINGEAGANTNIALGETLTITGTDGVNTTISAGQVAISVDTLDGGSF